MRFILLILASLLCSPSWAQHSQQNVNSFNTDHVSNSSVGALPACTASQNKVIRQVTDALTPTVGATVVGGGAVIILIHCNGANWVVA